MRARGSKRSSWLIFRRRLLLVRTLVRGPQSRDALIAAVQQEMHEGYIGDLAAAFKNDLDALKAEYGCQIAYQRKTGQYLLGDLGELALLDLSDSCMEALAFLETSFPEGSAIPEHAHIRELLDRMMFLLPTARREQHARRRHAIALWLGNGPAQPIDASVMRTVRRAIAAGQELTFEYRSNEYDGTPLRLRVAPYAVFFRPEGHGYLEAALLESQPHDGRVQIGATLHYRLDRMVPKRLHILPKKLPPSRIAPPSVQIRYWLHPNVARRRDISAHFPETVVVYHDDGSATVTAAVHNLWQTRQTLLRYGSACRVEAPPELVELVRATIRELAALYGEPA